MNRIAAQGSGLDVQTLTPATLRAAAHDASSGGRGGAALLEVALEVGRMGTWWWDRETGAGAWSDAQYRLLGFRPGEVEPDYARMLALVVPEDQAKFERACVEVFARGEIELEFRIRRTDGEERWVLGRGRAVDGRFALGVNIDVTERKRAEQAARARDETLALALEAGGMGTWEVDLRADALHCADALAAILGVPAAEMRRGSDFTLMVVEEDRPRHRAAVQRLISRGDAEVEFRIRRPDGEVRWLHGRGRLVSGGARAIAFGVAHDITAAKRTELALRESETRLQLAFAAGRMGAWDWDVTRDAVHWSEGMYELLGLPRDAPPSSARFMAMILDADRPTVEAAVTRSLVAGDFVEEFRMRRADGRTIWVAARGAALRDADGRALRLLGANFDITDRKAAEAERDQASRRKDEFLAMLAHELRNPLAAIGAAAAVLPETAADARAAAAAGVIGRQVRHLARLVEDLVDLAQIERGRVDLRREPTELQAVVHQALEQVEPVIAAHAQSVALRAPDVPVHVLGDATRLAQVFANLLSNAAKYSPQGARIDVALAPHGDAVEVAVEDSGVGIDAAMLPHLFEPFTQGPRTLDRAEGGLGIGLAVVKSLVELHGGSVHAASGGSGQGARFTVRLPRLDVVSAPLATAACAPASAARRVLVVDDNADAAESLAMLLQIHGHTVEVALDAEAALAAAARFAPDVALLDIGLPGMDGYALAATLRADPARAGMKLVALTGYGRPQDRERSHAAGFDQHLVKPVDETALARCLAGG